jgi:hypothetical protein
MDDNIIRPVLGPYARYRYQVQKQPALAFIGKTVKGMRVFLYMQPGIKPATLGIA